MNKCVVKCRQISKQILHLFNIKKLETLLIFYSQNRILEKKIRVKLVKNMNFSIRKPV